MWNKVITGLNERWSRRCCCAEARVPEAGGGRAVSQGPVRAAECGAAVAVGRRTGGHGRVAGTTDGIGQTGTSKGGLGQSNPRGAELVFGEQPSDWRARGNAVVSGSCGGLVRAAEGRRPAAAARAVEASRRLPAHHRMVDTETRRV